LLGHENALSSPMQSVRHLDPGTSRPVTKDGSATRMVIVSLSSCRLKMMIVLMAARQRTIGGSNRGRGGGRADVSVTNPHHHARRSRPINDLAAHAARLAAFPPYRSVTHGKGRRLKGIREQGTLLYAISYHANDSSRGREAIEFDPLTR